jgi:FtsZ-interacting cell division protein ZipA
MVRQDIVSGLKNAVERGYSLEQAKATLINSGYQIKDVDEAANYLTGGLGTEEPQTNEQIEQQSVEHTIEHPEQPQQQVQQQMIQQQMEYHEPKKKGKKTVLIILLIFLLLILVAGLGLAFYFREDVISFFGGLFGG